MRLFCLLTASALLLCCNCTYGKIHRKSKTNTPTETALKVQVDDSVKRYLGDSLSQIVFDPDSVTLLSLSVKPVVDSLNTASEKTDSIASHSFHGCYIKHNYGVLSKSEIYPILLILSDRNNYIPDGFRLKSPFTPIVALSFKKGNDSVDIIFSFTGGQLYLFKANEEKLYFKYAYERLIMKFFNSFLKDEHLAKYMNL